MDIARHVIKRILNPRILETESYYVVSSVHQSLQRGVPGEAAAADRGARGGGGGGGGAEAAGGGGARVKLFVV